MDRRERQSAVERGRGETGLMCRKKQLVDKRWRAIGEVWKESETKKAITNKSKG